ncbi:uncharacterized protein LDX57_009894 [Aspergillus melleus]|uniref:uncharacterized protein n=1 Tax=Aspergillus melleus TaxID=138277 RepID=UPI001E8CA7F6|nr:uncharacterized protein LDX57_009894 [Aspergillus melleus]KAH8432255.1 hypothetical protein LDX57_009894 [Aspergillus melleus]
MDTATEIYDEQDDYRSDADEPTGVLEINTSSDWYQPQASNETSNRGRRRRARHSSVGSVPAHNPSRIQIHENEAHRIIEPGVVIAEGGPQHL